MVFLGREISEQRDYGDKIADAIDQEVHGLIEQAYNQAKDILTENRAKLVHIAEQLMENETIEGEALAALFDSEVPVSEKKTEKTVIPVTSSEITENQPQKTKHKKLPGDSPPKPLQA
ncbi:MAG: hypothetical protein HQ553_13060 [Chloroflexi bacterium]|nr:hypothetical protein [Chloroflexota bacterium]